LVTGETIKREPRGEDDEAPLKTLAQSFCTNTSLTRNEEEEDKSYKSSVTGIYSIITKICHTLSFIHPLSFVW